METKQILQKMGIDYILPDRNYWLVRTNGGQYFDDFYFDGYIGIEWDEIVSQDYKDMEYLKKLVEENYPNEQRTGYVAAQIDKFVHQFKQGDIVIIPNKNSQIFAIGEIAEDNIYIAEEQRDGLIFEEDLETQVKFLKKRRKVNWIKCYQRNELDNRLQTFIYAHNTIVDLNNYSLFIDRTLSNYYIKGDEAYFTFRVNKTSRIALDNMTDVFLFNRELCNFVNKYFPSEYHIVHGEIISKVDVQSKGPIQLSGPIKKILAIGLVSTIICGGSVKINIKEGLEISSGGLIELVKVSADLYDKIKKDNETDEYQQLKEDYELLLQQYNSCLEELMLTVPNSSTDNIVLESSDIIEEVEP